MSDKPTVSVETTIEAAPDEVYELASDLGALGGMGTEFQGGEWRTGRPRALGSTFLGRNKRGENEWETVSTIIESEPGRGFAWAVGDVDRPLATWGFSFRGVPDGTEVRFTATMGPGESGLTSAIDANPSAEAEIIDKRLRHHQDNMVKVLEGIRRRLERR